MSTPVFWRSSVQDCWARATSRKSPAWSAPAGSTRSARSCVATALLRHVHDSLAMLTFADIEAARAAIGDRLHRTPLFRSATLGELAGARVFLKAELFQKTGSFKPRGVLNNLAALSPAERARGVISISAGNHAQALAWGAAAEGIDALLVMWQGASPAKIDATRGYGATVDLEAKNPTEAFDRLAALQDETGRTLIHPFDHPRTIAGQGTVGLDIVEDLPETTTLLVPVGGGGLISGIALAAEGRRVIGVEPELSPA